MTTAAWTRLDQKNPEQPMLEQVRGVDVSVQISPYDLPRAYRGFYVEDRGAFRIEFQYPDEEPRETLQSDDGVQLEIGIHSKKLLSIEICVDSPKVDMVRLDVQEMDKILGRADKSIQRLKKTTQRPNAKLNYSAVDRVLKSTTSAALVAS